MPGFYTQLTDDSSVTLYEAFCVSGYGGDYGYQLYIPADTIDGTLQRIQIIVGDGEEDFTLVAEQ